MLVLVSQDHDSYIVFSKRRPIGDVVLFDVVENWRGRPTYLREEAMAEDAMQTALFTLAGRGWMTTHHADRGRKVAPEATDAPTSHDLPLGHT